MRPVQKAAALLSRTEIGKGILNDERYRMILSAGATFALNLLYALYHCILGIINLSLWFITMCAFYAILATVRFSAVLFERRHTAAAADTEYFVMKLAGVLLMALSIVLSAVVYISMSQHIATKYGEIIMITIATCTFGKITMAAIRAVKHRRNPSPLLSALNMVGYAEAATSVLTLQRSMIASFGSSDDSFAAIMNASTGAAVCLFVFGLGSYMAINGKKKGMINNVKNSK